MVKVKLCVMISISVIFVLFAISLFLMSIVDPKPLVIGNKTQEPKLMAEDVYDIVFPMPTGGLRYGLEKASESDILNHSKKMSKIVPIYKDLVKKGAQNNSSKGEADPPSKAVRRSVDDIGSRNRNTDVNSGVVLKIIDNRGNPRIEIKLGPKGNLEGAKRSYRSLPSNSFDNASDTLNKIEAITENNTGVGIKILYNNKLVYGEKGAVNYRESKPNKDCSTCSVSLTDEIQEINYEDPHEILILINTKESNNENIDKITTMNYTDLSTISGNNSQESTMNFTNNVLKEHFGNKQEEKVSFIETETTSLSDTGLENATDLRVQLFLHKL